MDKRKEKIAKKIIKFRCLNSKVYKLDKYLKIIKVKINKLEFIESINEGKRYKVNYERGLNMWNPFSWIAIIVAFFMVLSEYMGEIMDDLKTLKTENLTETIKIKD
ncbi:hypothetical protein [Clostridium botulinum]|uniref:Uncharacterized protein n=1 Tax=Clostridium botulinum CFSAN001627 TaxID=1232189 RepID=M1ZVR4_CLOBO|nr:hypothetical protein [Clostridium botulinum]EKN40888.1 hypothetical protein CFSAN001627_16748 [Clostridium botulinum CFSAN001627]APC84654.1 hypothetical protein NPD12_1473 [Clostridium botulinum]AXG95370.1 hypothetical protein AGE31_06650 [Clostridium botulinum]EDT82680.1 hypothetical protein CBN_1361 [Clostridium botulinum NCTC 2916]MBY6770507.1 hypothetical protein [Clostridium botulinum]